MFLVCWLLCGVCCLLCISYLLLLFVCWLFVSFVVCRLLFGMYWSLFVLSLMLCACVFLYVLYGACCLLFVVRCVWCVVRVGGVVRLVVFSLLFGRRLLLIVRGVCRLLFIVRLWLSFLFVVCGSLVYCFSFVVRCLLLVVCYLLYVVSCSFLVVVDVSCLLLFVSFALFVWICSWLCGSGCSLRVFCFVFGRCEVLLVVSCNVLFVDCSFGVYCLLFDVC